MARVQWLLGLGLTAVLAWLVATGHLDRLEYFSQDLRQKAFHTSRPEPSPEVAVILIDDAALENYGRWPWRRSLLATAVDQLTLGGASVVAFDLLLNEPQDPELVRLPDGSVSSIDHDALLSESIRENSRCILATSFAHATDQAGRRLIVRADGALRLTFEAAYAEVDRNFEVSDSQIWTNVLESLDESEILRPPAMSDEDTSSYIRNFRVVDGPSMEDTASKASIARTLIGQRERSSVRAPSDPLRWPPSNAPQTPIAKLAGADVKLASVSFVGGDFDAAVRRIPLWTQVGERLYPTLGLAAAAMHLEAQIPAIRPARTHTSIPLTSADSLEAPTHRAPLNQLSELGPLEGMLYITWPSGGFDGWRGQFPDIGGVPREVPLGWLLDPPLRILPTIRENVRRIDDAMLVAGTHFGLIQAATHGPRSKALLDRSPLDKSFSPLFEEHLLSWRQAITDAQGMLESLALQGLDPATLTEQEKADIDLLQQIATRAPAQIQEIETGLERYRDAQIRQIPERIKGKVCFIGWSATGALADFVRTGIDGRTPGVMIHAAVANSILVSTQGPKFLTPASRWVDIFATLILGAIGTFIGVRSSVVISPLALITFMVGWIAFDGVVLWDRGNLVVALTAPLAAAFFGWLLVTLHRLLIEQRGRKRTEERFRAYVPPDVVDILVNNPALSSMAPQKRELTMFFSDIEGFTTLSERLGTEGVSKLLSAYLGSMTQILLARRATLDKYLGDGIMAFWGAPLEDPAHARNAVAAAVQMIEQLQWMNDAGAFDDAAKGIRLAVRIGLATGEVNVGDFGNPPSKSAYTVIGDAVNLAARLESANKQFGTKILINQRLRDLIGDEFPLRAIGRVVVKGKKQFETLHEVLCPGRTRGDQTREWVECSNNAVNAFINKDFDTCLIELARLENDFDDGMLADVYRHAVATIRMDPKSIEGFTGAIVLSEK